MTRFYVKVDPGGDAFAIDTTGTYPRITLTQPAEGGRANSELVTRLSEVLGTDVGIVAGHRRSRKELVADLPEDEITERMASHADG